MLEGAKFWTKGHIELLDPKDNKVKKFYVSRESIQKTYNHIKYTLQKKGKIPIGIDHIPPNLLENFPILKKMDVLNVGEITDVKLIDDSIYINKANIFNPTIQELYEAGELTSLSMVGYMKTEPCKQDPKVQYVLDNEIISVDIVDEGACKTCKIPPPNNMEKVGASKVKIPIKILEANKMTEPNINPNEPQEPETNEEEVSTLGKLIKQLEGIVKMLKKEDNEENNEPKQEKAGETSVTLNNNNAVPAPTGASSADAVMARKVEQLEKELETYKKAQASAYVEQLVSAGKVAPATKEHYIKLAEYDIESVQTIMASAPVQFPMGQKSLKTGAGQPFNKDDDPNDPENIIRGFEVDYEGDD